MKDSMLAVVLLAACGTSSPPTTPPAHPAAAPAPVASDKSQVAEVSFHADHLDVDKKMEVYLPAGYDTQPDTRWPVLYYLHGLGGDEKSWMEGGDLTGVADQLKLQAIIVMPDGDTGFYADAATPADQKGCLAGKSAFLPEEPNADYCVGHADYETYMTKDVVPYVDAHYRTIADRTGRGVAGFSMGGYGALMLAMRHPDVWSAAASHSGVDALLYAGPWPYVKGKAVITDDVAHWGAQVEPIGALVRSIFGKDLANWKAHDPALLAQSLKPGDLALYLDCGTEDDFHLDAEAQYLHDVLTDRGIPVTYFIGPGRHDFEFWKPREPVSLQWFEDQLSKPRAK